MNRFFFNLAIFIFLTLSGCFFESFCSDEEKNGHSFSQGSRHLNVPEFKKKILQLQLVMEEAALLLIEEKGFNTLRVYLLEDIKTLRGKYGFQQEQEAAEKSIEFYRYFFPDCQEAIERSEEVLRLKVHNLYQAELRSGEKTGLAKQCIENAVVAGEKGSQLLKAEGLLTSSGRHSGWYGYEYNFSEGIEILKGLVKSANLKQEALANLIHLSSQGDQKILYHFLQQIGGLQKSSNTEKLESILEGLRMHCEEVETQILDFCRGLKV